MGMVDKNQINARQNMPNLDEMREADSDGDGVLTLNELKNCKNKTEFLTKLELAMENNDKYTWKEPSLKDITTQTQTQDNSEYAENIDNEADDEESEDEVIEEDSFYDEILTKEESDLISKNIKPPQKELTQGERNAKFEHEMSIAFDKFINNFGEYYKHTQLKDRTFTYNLSCYLNNSMYKSEYISGDFENGYEGVNLGRDFDSFMMRLPIHFRDDYDTNYDMRYKIQLTHTPKGTTVKLIKVWHYLVGD